MSKMVKNPKTTGDDSPTPNWLDLPEGVTENILGRLENMELLEKVQFTCRDWYMICKSPQLWLSIEMKPCGVFNDDDDPRDDMKKQKAEFAKLTKACRSAVDRSAGELRRLSIEYFCDDELLKYITDRCHKIKSLRLAACDAIWDQVLIDVVSNLALLEELEITECELSFLVLQAVGKACPKLNTFKLCDEWVGKYYESDEEFEGQVRLKDDDDATAIANHMSSLKHLHLIGNRVTNEGLTEILSGCPGLISLDVRECFNLTIEGRLKELCASIGTLRLPDDSISDEEFLASLG